MVKSISALKNGNKKDSQVWPNQTVIFAMLLARLLVQDVTEENS